MDGVIDLANSLVCKCAPRLSCMPEMPKKKKKIKKLKPILGVAGLHPQLGIYRSARALLSAISG